MQFIPLFQLSTRESYPKMPKLSTYGELPMLDEQFPGISVFNSDVEDESLSVTSRMDRYVGCTFLHRLQCRCALCRV
jgi:hypothetical protein